MNTVELNSCNIEILFDNCECITVDMWAIKYFNFEVIKEDWIWDPNNKKFLKTNRVNNFNLLLNVTEPKYFSQTARLVDGYKTVTEIGQYCIERLKNSDDICGFNINGINYTVPWNRHEKPTDLGIPIISNTYQMNTASINKNNESTLQIKIKEEPNGSGENQEKH